ncbi:MAG: PEGA domain-containing protein [Planctomycetota bacterium]
MDARPSKPTIDGATQVADGATQVADGDRVSRTVLQRYCRGWLIVCVCGLLLSTACVRRRMIVRTNPPGALVSIGNQVVGTTPAAASFNYYGVREFRVEKDGFKTETFRRNIKPPWYQLPVIDFFAETLWPGELRDDRIIDIQLQPQTLPPAEVVTERADALRFQARAGVITSPR